MSLGTSGTLFGFSKTPVIDPKGNLAAFCSSSGGWLPLLCTMNCTVASEEFRSLLEMDVVAFDAEASTAPIGSDGIVILPFFNGERTPNLPEGRASVNGITAANFNRRNLARAALESAIFGMRIGLEGFKSMDFKPKEIRLTGGGSRSHIWQNIAANVMDLPVRIPVGTEAAAMGGAIQALWCLETHNQKMQERTEEVTLESLTDEHVALGTTIKPNKKDVKKYNEAYAVYSRYLKVLGPLYS
jgi:xylulokinase